MRFILLVLVYNMIVVDCVERCSHPQAEDGHQISEGCLLRTCKAGVWRTSLAGNLCCYERTAYTINTTISSSMSKDGCVKVDIDCVEEIPGQAKMILSMKNYCEEFATQEQIEEIKELLVRQRGTGVGCQGGDEEGEEKEGQELSPRITIHPHSQIVPKNDPVTLNCEAEGYPEPEYTWYRNGEIVLTAPSSPKSHRVILPAGSLFFLNVRQNEKEQDGGVYWCEAANSVGKARSKNATLVIHQEEKCDDEHTQKTIFSHVQCSQTSATNAYEKILDVENKEIVKKILCNSFNTIRNVCTADLATCFGAEDIEIMNESILKEMKTFLIRIARGKVDENDLDDCII